MASLLLATHKLAADRTRGAKLIGPGAPLLSGGDDATGLQLAGFDPTRTETGREVA